MITPDCPRMPSAVITPNPNLRTLHWNLKSQAVISSSSSVRCASSLSQPPPRYAVLGAGLAGLSVAWHLLEHSPKEFPISIDIYDEFGIGGGASGVAGGLLHPYSPKVKLLWRGAECWNESLKLLRIAEATMASKELNSETPDFAENCTNRFIVRRRGILRPAISLKHLNILIDNAQNCLPCCKIQSIDRDAAQNLVPSLCVPLNSAFYMPEAINVHPQRYLKALFLACEDLAKNLSTSCLKRKELHLHKMSVNNLLELEGTQKHAVV